MYSPKDSEPAFQLPVKAPQAQQSKPTETWRQVKPGFESNGQQLRTVDHKPMVKMPEIEWRSCFMGCVGGPNGPIEIHEDRYFFDGGGDDGYESYEDAEEARDEAAALAGWMPSDGTLIRVSDIVNITVTLAGIAPSPAETQAAYKFFGAIETEA